MADHAKKFQYDRWASGEMIAALTGVASPPEKSVAIAAHIVATLYLWHSRISGADHAIAVWPDWPLQHVLEMLTRVEPLWLPLLEQEQVRTVRYMNSKGETFESTTDDIIEHVFFHGAYHRGQIASLMRAAGYDPPYTDYIHARRSGKL